MAEKPVSIHAADDLEDAELRDLHAYWRQRRRGNLLPARGDIDPVDLTALLPYLILTDVVADVAADVAADVTAGVGTIARRRYRFRLAGTVVERHFGPTMTGRYIDDLLTGAYLDYLTGLYDNVVEHRRPLFSRSRFGDGAEALSTRRLMLPLARDGVTVDMVLSVQVFARATPNRRDTVTCTHALFQPDGEAFLGLEHFPAG